MLGHCSGTVNLSELELVQPCNRRRWPAVLVVVVSEVVAASAQGHVSGCLCHCASALQRNELPDAGFFFLAFIALPTP
jgi:hypothetical protein